MNDDEVGRLRAYLDDELPVADARAVEAELAESSALRMALEEIEQLDREAAQLLVFDDPEPGLKPTARRGGVVAVVAAVTALAAAVLFFMWPVADGPSRGSIDAQRRETIAIGDRAVGVAEAGSTLSWNVAASGETRVRQQEGSVFYRVDAGETFEVATPAGTITVTGTCFTVELRAMNSKTKTLVSAGVGATLATAILLTVHEGSVVLANDEGDLEVRAGQSAKARAGRAPAFDDEGDHESEAGPPATYETLVAENKQQRVQLRKLTAALERRTEADDSPEPVVDRNDPAYRLEVARECAVNGGCDSKLWLDPSPEELRELANCGRVLVDTPSFMVGRDFFPPGHIIEAAGLSEAEAGRYAAIAEEFYGRRGHNYAELAHELGVPAELVGRLDPVQLRGIVQSVIDNDTHDAMRQRTADERAAISTAPPIEEQSAGERAIRLDFGLGSDFERTLGEEFGADAAAEMRAAGGGWSNKSSMGDGECSR